MGIVAGVLIFFGAMLTIAPLFETKCEGGKNAEKQKCIAYCKKHPERCKVEDKK